MKMNPPLIALVMCAGTPALAVDYMVDFTRMEDYENLRPVIEQCADFGAMELQRDRMASAADLNDLRAMFQRTGFGMFNDCPEGITGAGIERVEDPATAR